MKFHILFIASLLSIQLIGLNDTYADAYGRMPQSCSQYINDLRSGKIDPEKEIERTHSVRNAVGGGGLLGLAAYGGMNLGIVGAFGGTIAGGAAIPIIGWGVAAVAGLAGGSYLLYRAYQGHKKIECMKIAQGINISLKESNDPRMNDSVLSSVKSGDSRTNLNASNNNCAPGDTPRKDGSCTAHADPIH